MSSKAVPVVVGVGDVVNRSLRLEDAQEPIVLMHNAILKAVDDTSLSKTEKQLLITQIDSLSIVRTWTWEYPDCCGSLSDRLGIMPSHSHYSDHGGNSPGKIFDEAARRIAQRQSQVAIVTGGEALASLNAFVKAKRPPPWTKPAKPIQSVFSPTTRDLETGNTNSKVADSWAADNTGGLGKLHNVGRPIEIYPLYENAYRAHHGQSIAENSQESAKMYAEFSKVAANNPFAWTQSPQTAEAIGTVTKKNRMICFPYPLLQNAFNTVNLAAACLLTSTEYAEELGIPKSRWIYPLGGAGSEDSHDFWERPNFYSSPSISRSIDAALSVTGLTKDDIDIYDIYSCFPVVPKMACDHLGLPITPKKPITLLGGLTSFGGAGNNYSMHALTAMVRELRKGGKGLVLANGGVVTYQHVVILSSQPKGSYPDQNPIPLQNSDVPVPFIDAEAEGEAVIETYTVEFGRNGQPKIGHIVGRLKSNDHRFIANHGNESTLQQLASFSKEPIGRIGKVFKDVDKRGRNLFVFEEGNTARL